MSIAAHTTLGGIQYQQGFDIDWVLRVTAKHLRDRGLTLAGAVQHSIAAEEGCRARMDLIDLRSDRVVGISQDLGRHGRGCHLDQHGLAEVAGMIGKAITSGVDFVIINRFGKAEADGDGLLSCLTDAIGAGIPVLTAVREPYLDAWHTFHGGLATELPPLPAAVLEWCETMAIGGQLVRRQSTR